MTIGFTCGTFDLCHAGHLLMFEECKAYCDYLIVGVCTDPTNMQSGKNKPVESIFERYVRLKSCKFIDEVYVYQDMKDVLALVGHLYGKYGDNLVRFMDESYRGSPNTTEYGLPIKVHFNTRRHEYSSTNLRNRCTTSKSQKRS